MNAIAEREPAAQAAPAAPAVIVAPERSELDRLLRQDFNPRELLLGDSFDRMLHLAEVMASGKTTIPLHLRGNVGDCMAVITQAMQWGFNPFAVAQKTHLVNGTLGYEAQLVIAALNASPLLVSRINFRWADDWNGAHGAEDASPAHWVEAWAQLRGEPEPRVIRVSMAQVGSVRNSPNWRTDARQQLAYLAAKRWGRLHAPDVILGVYTPDELQAGEIDAPAAPPFSAPPAPAPAPAQVWPDEAFEKQFARWSQAVAKGLKSIDDIVGMATSKGVLTEAQEKRIRGIPAPQEQQSAGTAAATDETPPWQDTPRTSDPDPFVSEMERAERDGGQQ